MLRVFSAVLQVAKAFFLATGVNRSEPLFFAFWDGEEKGLLGSKYFVQTFSEMDKVKGYLNYDMIGRNKRRVQADACRFISIRKRILCLAIG